MAKLILYTFSILQQPRDHEQINEFDDRNPFIYTSAENSEGTGPVIVGKETTLPVSGIGALATSVPDSLPAGSTAMPRQPFLFGKMWSRFTPLPTMGSMPRY